MKILVGDTGLIGTTLKEKITFESTFNSKNIQELQEIKDDNVTIYLSCLPATKWLVNKDIKSDIKNINSIIEIISKLRYKKIILISTIDVYCDSPQLSDEDTIIHVKNLSYGTNRYYFELLVKNLCVYEDLKIFRLPALYNKHIKKNILYDLINNNNVNQINANSSFQWYNLNNLDNDIRLYSALHPKRNVFNLFTEPLDSIEIVKLFPHHIPHVPFSSNRNEYNFKTNLNKTGYILSKDEVLNDIKEFVHEVSTK
jgi:nucleoside-diphosphate-sugar epimerase